jgi:serine protease Do
MNWFEKARRQKALSLTAIFLALTIGILIGTVINTGVQADKGPALTDATPLVIPNPVQLQNEFSALAKKLEPAVVNITVEHDTRSARRAAQQPDADDDDDQSDLFRRFFGQEPFGGGQGRSPRGLPQQPRRSEATGSGFIVDPKGYIITNNHVVDDADRIVVKLHDDPTKYRAKLIGTDVDTDLAIIKIDTGKPLPFAKVGNSDSVQVGDWAVAIGSPFGFEASVTAGIVSAKGREVSGARQFQRFIQTDAAINPGNSGGPLLNIRGEVIGINTAIATNTGSYQGIGFALPVNVAAKVYNAITQQGRVTRGSIGIGMARPEVLKALGHANGVLIERVEPSGPSERAGLKANDIITSINGQALKDGDDLVGRVSDTPLGQKLKLSVDRDGKKMDFDVAVADRTEVFKDLYAGQRSAAPEAGEATETKFGISALPLTPAQRDELKIEGPVGVKVTTVVDGSFADEIGLQVGDIILSVGRQAVSSSADMQKIRANLKPGDAVAFRVMRENPLSTRRGAGGPRYITTWLSGTLPSN